MDFDQRFVRQIQTNYGRTGIATITAFICSVIMILFAILLNQLVQNNELSDSSTAQKETNSRNNIPSKDKFET